MADPNACRTRQAGRVGIDFSFCFQPMDECMKIKQCFCNKLAFGSDAGGKICFGKESGAGEVGIITI